MIGIHDISYDLGSVSSTWVLRWQMDPTTVSSTGGSGSQTFVGLVDDVSILLHYGFPDSYLGARNMTTNMVKKELYIKQLLANNDPDNSWYSLRHNDATY